MKRIKSPLRRFKYRTRAILNVLCIALAVLLWYAGRGFPYFSWEQDLRYSLRRSLAEGADIIYSGRVPEGCGTWSDEAEETVYIVRWQNNVGTMRMMREHVGKTWYGGPNRYIMRYPDRGGMAIVPLHGAFPVEDEIYEIQGFRAAVVPFDPAVERVDVVYTTSEAPPVVYPAENAGNGVFIADIKPDGGEHSFWHTDVYSGTLAANCLGAVCYDGDGNVVAQSASAWEEHHYEN